MDNNKVSLCLFNPKSPQNMGSILRAAGCYSVASVFYTGERYARAKGFATDTKDAGLKIPVTNISNIQECVHQEQCIVVVELVEGATPLPNFEHPDNALYIFGPEDGTLPQDVIYQSHHVVYIPTKGCMNLAATVNVVLYDRMAKSPLTEYNDDIIRASRDTNNRTKVP